MKIVENKVEEWYSISQQLNKDSVCFKPEFINAVCNAFSLTPVSWVVYKDEHAVLGLLSYKSNKSLVHPCIYIYTAIWSNSSDIIVQQAWLTLIESLKLTYSNIHFLFPPEVTDVRPFIRSGFRTFVNYTYLKDLTDLSFSSKLLSREKKAAKHDIDFIWDDTNPDVIEQYRRDFEKYGFGENRSAQFIAFFKKLLEKGFAKAISGRLNGELVASGVILIDNEAKQSMNLLISSEKRHYETGVHTALYINIFRNLKQAGILSNDLYGANTLGIGNFKSNFSQNLVPHYEVKYNSFRFMISERLQQTKKFINRYLK